MKAQISALAALAGSGSGSPALTERAPYICWPISETARSLSSSARKSPSSIPVEMISSSNRIMSSPIIISAPPTAAAPAAPVVAWVAMANRKKAGLSSIRSSTPPMTARRRSKGGALSSNISTTVSLIVSYIDCTQALRSSSRLAKYT
jgi:hypothetical protein